ncbi:hypothetical protein BJY00DRAFT_74389 [Aspergillus carlsbadensis]|nr:hypothetical protein BJY00DRAFT_74389 [Aspergillus carlsbadensis]
MVWPSRSRFPGWSCMLTLGYRRRTPCRINAHQYYHLNRRVYTLIDAKRPAVMVWYLTGLFLEISPDKAIKPSSPKFQTDCDFRTRMNHKWPCFHLTSLFSCGCLLFPGIRLVEPARQL